MVPSWHSIIRSKWQVCLCALTESPRLNLFPQISHAYFFTWVWQYECFSNRLGYLNVFPQTGHGKGLSGFSSWDRRPCPAKVEIKSNWTFLICLYLLFYQLNSEFMKYPLNSDPPFFLCLNTSFVFTNYQPINATNLTISFSCLIGVQVA